MQTLHATPTLPAVTGETFRAFHGTERAAATAITDSGFIPSSRAQYGPGVYLCRGASDADMWAGRTAAGVEVAANGGRRGVVDWSTERDCALIEVTVPAELRAVTLTVQPTPWGAFRALGDANGTLVER